MSTWYEKVWIPAAKVRVKSRAAIWGTMVVWVQESCCGRRDCSLLVVLQSGEDREADRSRWIFHCVSLDVQLVLFAYARRGLCIRSLLSSVPVIGLRTHCGDLSGECILGKGSGPLWPLNKIRINGRMEVWRGAAHTLTRWGWVRVWSCAQHKGADSACGRRTPAHFAVSVIGRVALDETGGKHVDYLNSSSLLMITRDGLAIWWGGQMPKGAACSVGHLHNQKDEHTSAWEAFNNWIWNDVSWPRTLSISHSMWFLLNSLTFHSPMMPLTLTLDWKTKVCRHTMLLSGVLLSQGNSEAYR